jgi:hypothetical protein
VACPAHNKGLDKGGKKRDNVRNKGQIGRGRHCGAEGDRPISIRAR